MPVPTSISADLLLDWPLPTPDASADKAERGRLLIVAGSGELAGAAWLAAVAAFRAGAGKVVIGTVASAAPGLALALPEARVIALPEAADGSPAMHGVGRLEPVLAEVDAILLGPGLQGQAASCAFVAAVLAAAARRGDEAPAILLDALAMDVVGGTAAPFERPPLLTPHAGEMAHLTGLDKQAVCAAPLPTACDAAKRWNAVVALKGARTVIAAPDGAMWQHDGGQAGLAVSGSGDVLAGIAAGLAARGAPLEQAAAWAVFLHARAGAALAARIGPIGFLASELAAEIPRLMARHGRNGERR